MSSIYAQRCTFIASQTKREGDITKDILKFDNLGCVSTQIVFGNVQFPAQYQEDIVKKYLDYQNIELTFDSDLIDKTCAEKPYTIFRGL